MKRGIEADQLYIVPYPEVRENLEKHFQAIIEFDPATRIRS